MPMDIVERFLRPIRTQSVTRRYPEEPALLAPAMRGLPVLDPTRCDSSASCVSACPTGAITLGWDAWTVDAGRCVMCAACESACPRDAIRLGQRFELAGRTRGGLQLVTRIEGGP
jgi:formate hydrogenlyase subunit 6/NADH:ubiquinone oxidoreductase subunit I